MFCCKRWTGERWWNVIQWKRHGVFLNVHFWVQLTKFNPSGRFALNKILSPGWLKKFYTSFMTGIRFIANSKRPVCTIDIFFFVIKSKPKKFRQKQIFFLINFICTKNNLKNCGKLLKVLARHHKVTLSQAHLDLILKINYILKNQKWPWESGLRSARSIPPEP